MTTGIITPVGRETGTGTGTERALRAYRYWTLRYRRTWRGTVVISVANPLLFLIAMGLGLGRLISPDSAVLGGVDYLAFFAPGMLAAASMQNGIIEAAFPVSWSRRPGGAYPVAAGTPLEPEDILHGHLLFMTVRVALSAAAFLLVMVAFGAARSPLVWLTLLAATLTGMAFALPAAAWAVTLTDVGPVTGIFKWVVMPLYLFSGTFFAVEQLPDALRPVVYVTPLWHGVDLCRTLSLGTATWPTSLAHVAYLSALVTAGYLLARRNYRRNLYA
ncbi:lipooligosaccharide transport system permease protein [Micromonospora pisi]|uniref:Transport permease protein n=1 Tax=Micromonospora pisi TaxID=589240 RepID=A0A495JUM3_9ACTN|nr:ABC transporter permease [Micromonospora pisi]RKR92012.1 lipooligosaccharide transport system permease protein [Micromonospora pisi]